MNDWMIEWAFTSISACELWITRTNISHNHMSSFIIYRFYYICNNSFINITILFPHLLEYRRHFVAICLLFYPFVDLCWKRKWRTAVNAATFVSVILYYPSTPPHPPPLFSPLSLQRNSGVDWLTYHLKLIIPLSRPLRSRFNQK